MTVTVRTQIDKEHLGAEVKKLQTAVSTLETTVSGISTTELGYIDGVTAGTAAANKAYVGDANKAIDVVRTASLRIGASGSEVDKTNVIIGAAAGYKIARGVASITGSGTVVTGLTTVVAVVAMMQADASLTNGISVTGTIGDQAGSPAAGSVILKVWKPTASNDVTPIASAAAVSVNWVAVGT